MVAVRNSRNTTDTAVKSLSENRVGGYLVVWGDDEQRDLQGEYFTSTTDFALDWYEKRPVLYHHGLDGSLKTESVGVIDVLKSDDVGLWAEAQLNARTEYEKAIKELIERGALGWSSGSLAHLVEQDGGEIKRWPLVEGSLTPTPAEPRQTDVQAIKSAYAQLGLDMGKLGLPTTDDDKEPNGEAKGHRARDNDDTTHEDKGKTTMPSVKALDEEVKQYIDEELKRYMQDVRAMLEEENMSDVSDEDMSKMEDMMRKEMDDEDFVKMDDEDTEGGKSINVNDISRKFPRLFAKAYEELVSAKAERQSETRKVLQSARKSQIDRSAPHSTAGKSSFTPNKPEPLTISVEEERRYAHLTAAQMAMGVKMAMAELPEYKRKGATFKDLSGILSEGYIKTAMHKINREYHALEAPKVKREGDWLTEDHYAMKSFAPRAVKADELNATDITSQGLEWVTVFYDTNLWRRARNRTELFDKLTERGMRVVTIPDGSKTMNVKLDTSSSTVYTINEGNDVDSTNRPEVTIQSTPFGTGEVTADAKMHAVADSITYQLEEDSIIDVIQWANEDMARSLQEALEDALINGDTETGASTNINLIDGTPATGLDTPLYIVWDGIRKNALVDNTSLADTANGTLTIATYEEALQRFPSEINQRRSDILFVVDYRTESLTRRLPELLTAGEAGSMATVYAGGIPNLFSVEVYQSGFLRLANTAGKISGTASNNTTGSILAIYAPYWQYGRKRAVSFESVRHPRSQTTEIVASVRHAFRARGANAASVTYNVGDFS